ncbi:protein of unknown function DUF77 [Pseudonocardia dioxanivorans CB1190]|uniref:Thiamine-binding protein domain-containing protein n=1 Tax=Pseudonocardia dioxanivorans (strain ATCC 55486 / DSM 44775 / JCM 13855 / CB1190) TaxID=675635 RepID=F4CKW1_PSEUX|nr:thiamine-binding protein [Pseudonocardia dioxanivorans]AEA23954.1 protein of unknown function DUF77 [Pseudonocardia dioxanivorans CB1190]
MLVAFSVAPAGGGSDSVADVVAEAVRVVRESGLPHETTSMFTTIEAETWDEAMDVVKRAVEAVQARSSRVSLVLKGRVPVNVATMARTKRLATQRTARRERGRREPFEGGC